MYILILFFHSFVGYVTNHFAIVINSYIHFIYLKKCHQCYNQELPYLQYVYKILVTISLQGNQPWFYKDFVFYKENYTKQNFRPILTMRSLYYLSSREICIFVLFKIAFVQNTREVTSKYIYWILSSPAISTKKIGWFNEFSFLIATAKCLEWWSMMSLLNQKWSIIEVGKMPFFSIKMVI